MKQDTLAIETLRNIANPIMYLKKKAEKQGAQLDGSMAVQLSDDPNFLRGLAEKTLRDIDKN